MSSGWHPHPDGSHESTSPGHHARANLEFMGMGIRPTPMTPLQIAMQARERPLIGYHHASPDQQEHVCQQLDTQCHRLWPWGRRHIKVLFEGGNTHGAGLSSVLWRAVTRISGQCKCSRKEQLIQRTEGNRCSTSSMAACASPARRPARVASATKSARRSRSLLAAELQRHTIMRKAREDPCGGERS